MCLFGLEFLTVSLSRLAAGSGSAYVLAGHGCHALRCAEPRVSRSRVYDGGLPRWRRPLSQTLCNSTRSIISAYLVQQKRYGQDHVGPVPGSSLHRIPLVSVAFPPPKKNTASRKAGLDQSESDGVARVSVQGGVEGFGLSFIHPFVQVSVNICIYSRLFLVGAYCSTEQNTKGCLRSHDVK